MFIVWGKTIKRQKLGFVADYCAVCRDLRTFQVRRVGQASHVYYISFGQGDLLGYERTCQSCSTPFDAVPDTYYGMSKQNLPPGDLITETFPGYYAAYRQQLEHDKKVRNTPSQLTPAERRASLREPFAVLAPLAQQKLSSMQVDAGVWLALLAFIPLIWLSATIGKFFSTSEYGEIHPAWALTGSAIGLALVIWQLSGSARRYLLKNVLPRLVPALAPLRPTEPELTEVLQELKQRRVKLGAKLRSGDLIAGIEQLRTRV
jgi:hypothetical protein